MKNLIPLVVITSSFSSCILYPEYWECKEQEQIQESLEAPYAESQEEVAKLKARVDGLNREIAVLKRRMAVLQAQQVDNSELREMERQLEEKTAKLIEYQRLINKID